MDAGNMEIVTTAAEDLEMQVRYHFMFSVCCPYIAQTQTPNKSCESNHQLPEYIGAESS
jgi:hypothetical protein